MPVMDEADYALQIDKHLCGHSAELENFHFLTIALQNGVGGVGNPDKGQPLHFPISPKGVGIFGTDDDDDGIPLGKLQIILTQLRHMPAAERSDKTPVKDQDDEEADHEDEGDDAHSLEAVALALLIIALG